jgi:hypothetical protein
MIIVRKDSLDFKEFFGTKLFKMRTFEFYTDIDSFVDIKTLQSKNL